MANELHTFTGNEVIATELPELLNQNFDYVRENSLKSVNGVEKDENNNVDVTFLTSQVIPTNSDLNNFRESGEYTREIDTVVVANSPTEKPFFLTVLASENLVKQVVTEIDLVDPITFTRTLSGANWSPWVEGGKVKSIMGLKANDEGDVDLTPLDYPTRYELGIWKSAEEVSVGDVRFLEGRENVGYVLECVANGITGEEQPTVVVDELANYSSVGRRGMITDNTTKWKVRKFTDFASNQAMPVGFEYFSTNPNIPIGRLPLFGGEYDRIIYADLWSWVQEQAGYLITEEEWQTYATNNDGNVPFYSSGDGSTTFRVPSMKCWVKGANSVDEVGSYLEGGLPNITGTADMLGNNSGNGLDYEASIVSGAFTKTNKGSTKVMQATSSDSTHLILGFDASRSNSIYGNSDTVQPPSIVGMWLVVAFGTVTNVGNLDMANVASGVENIQTRLNEHEHLLQENENALTIVGYHNSIYRGKYLGDKLTSAQSATIRAGEFEDLYIGDYWTIGGVNYRIVAFDYYYNCGDTACTTHHVVVVPDTILYSSQMNTENVTTGAYVGSAMYTTNLAQAKTTIGNAFGTNHLLTIRQYFSNAVTDGYESGGAWTDANVWLMNEHNVYGSPVFNNCVQGTNWANRYTIDNSQYPLFAMNPRMIHTRQTYWLRDVASSAAFAYVYGSGACNGNDSSSSRGVRPAFLVY